jgi:hypothetical protein
MNLPIRHFSRDEALGVESKEHGHLIQLERMKGTVDAAIQSAINQLPDKPHYKWPDDSSWTSWELKPVEAMDYSNQLDLFFASSVNAKLWQATHSRNFCSERFSRHGETFCYVKLDGSENLENVLFNDRSEIESALNYVLKEAGLGGHIGGGTGLRYAYIDLALIDVKSGIEAIRARLLAGNLPKRSWIQFYDSELATEWVRIYDDSPEPPFSFEE